MQSKRLFLGRLQGVMQWIVEYRHRPNETLEYRYILNKIFECRHTCGREGMLRENTSMPWRIQRRGTLISGVVRCHSMTVQDVEGTAILDIIRLELFDIIWQYSTDDNLFDDFNLVNFNFFSVTKVFSEQLYRITRE